MTEALAQFNETAHVSAKSTLLSVIDGLEALLKAKDELLRETYEAQEDLKAFKALEISDQRALEITKEVTAELKLKLERFESRKGEVTKPINAVLKLVHDFYRPLLTSLEAGEKELKGRMAKAIKRLREEQTKALKEASKASREGDMAKAKSVLVSMPAATTPENMSVREIWRFKVVDYEKIEDAYLMVVVNDGAVQAAIDAGAREIPGFEIYADDSVTIRKGK